MKEPACYKNSENPSCTDLFLTNCVTILRTSFELLPPKIMKCRNLKSFDEEKFDFYSKNV